MKKYLFPTLTIACLMIGFLIGNAVSNKVNAQRFYIQNGQLFSQPESKIDQLLQQRLRSIEYDNTALLMMTSGTFDGVNIPDFAKELIN